MHSSLGSVPICSSPHVMRNSAYGIKRTQDLKERKGASIKLRLTFAFISRGLEHAHRPVPVRRTPSFGSSMLLQGACFLRFVIIVRLAYMMLAQMQYPMTSPSRSPLRTLSTAYSPTRNGFSLMMSGLMPFWHDDRACCCWTDLSGD